MTHRINLSYALIATALTLLALSGPSTALRADPTPAAPAAVAPLANPEADAALLKAACDVGAATQYRPRWATKHTRTAVMKKAAAHYILNAICAATERGR